MVTDHGLLIRRHCLGIKIAVKMRYSLAERCMAWEAGTSFKSLKKVYVCEASPYACVVEEWILQLPFHQGGEVERSLTPFG